MRRTLLSLCTINFLVLYVFSSLLMADEFEAIRYRLNSNELKNIKTLGSIHLGRNIVLADSFLYYDYSDRPIIYVASFNDERSGQSVGSLYLTLNNLVPIEIIKGKPLHMFAYENLQHWLPALTGDFNQLELIRVYYYPVMYPILKVRLLLMDGTEKIVIVDPEHEQIITQHTLDTLAREYQLPESINRLKNPAIFGSDAIKSFDSNEWYTSQLDVYEVNTKGDWNGCEPAVAINVLGYWNDNAWEDMDCKFFHDQSALAYESEVNLLLIDLASNMGTSVEGNTWFPYAASALEKTVADKGYVCDARWASFLFDYSLAVDQIDLNRPCHLGGSISPSSIYFMHAVCVIGYKYAGSPEAADATTAYLIVHDGRKPNQPREVLWFDGWVNWVFNPINFMTVDFIECKSPSSSSSSTTTSITSTTSSTTTTTAKGDLDASACNATGALSVRASAPRYRTENGIKYCVADMYVKNNGSEAVGLIGFIAVNNRWSSMAPAILPGEEQDGYQFWQASTDINKNDLHQAYYYIPKITALYCVDLQASDPCSGCTWIFTYVNDNQQLPEGMQTIDIDSVNPCKGKAP